MATGASPQPTLAVAGVQMAIAVDLADGASGNAMEVDCVLIPCQVEGVLVNPRLGGGG